MTIRRPVTRLRRGESAFTMVEIALCLAIIGFALVAIIGVLPTGLNVQKNNREETIVAHDAGVWMDAIRNGAQGYNDLTNYVVGITNYWTRYDANTNVTGANADGFGPEGSSITSYAPAPVFPLRTGARIIGLLSTPKFFPPLGPLSGGPFQSNYLVAYVRAFSGSAAEKPPQDMSVRDDLGFTYRMIVENTAYVPFDPASVGGVPPAARPVSQLVANSRDLRLTFRWPVLPNGDTGNGRQTFRNFTGGWLMATNDPFIINGPTLFFFQPTVYVHVP